MHSRAVFGVAMLGLVLAGCGTVRGAAVRTGGHYIPPHNGPVAVYASGKTPAGALDLGVVEVHSVEGEGTLEELFPVFVRKVADIGGDAAVLDTIDTHFEVVMRPYRETFYYSCGRGASCVGSRMIPLNDEILYVSLRGRAYRVNAGERVAPAPVGDDEDSP